MIITTSFPHQLKLTFSNIVSSLAQLQTGTPLAHKFVLFNFTFFTILLNRPVLKFQEKTIEKKDLSTHPTFIT